MFNFEKFSTFSCISLYIKRFTYFVISNILKKIDSKNLKKKQKAMKQRELSKVNILIFKFLNERCVIRLKKVKFKIFCKYFTLLTFNI